MSRSILTSQRKNAVRTLESAPALLPAGKPSIKSPTEICRIAALAITPLMNRRRSPVSGVNSVMPRTLSMS